MCLSELLLGVPPHSGVCVPGSYSTLDSLSTFIACLYVAVMIFLYVCSQFVCYIDGYVCIVYMHCGVYCICV